MCMRLNMLTAKFLVNFIWNRLRLLLVILIEHRNQLHSIGKIGTMKVPNRDMRTVRLERITMWPLTLQLCFKRWSDLHKWPVASFQRAMTLMDSSWSLGQSAAYGSTTSTKLHTVVTGIFWCNFYLPTFRRLATLWVYRLYSSYHPPESISLIICPSQDGNLCHKNSEKHRFKAWKEYYFLLLLLSWGITFPKYWSYWVVFVTFHINLEASSSYNSARYSVREK